MELPHNSRKGKKYKGWEENKVESLLSAPKNTELYRIRAKRKKIKLRNESILTGQSAVYQVLSTNLAPGPENETEQRGIDAQEGESESESEEGELESETESESEEDNEGKKINSDNEYEELYRQIYVDEQIECDSDNDSDNEGEINMRSTQNLNENEVPLEDRDEDENINNDSEKEVSDDECENGYEPNYVDYARTRTLHDYTECTVDEAVYDLFHSHIKYCRTDRDLKKTLKNYSKILPKGHRMPETPYKFFKYIDKIAPPPEVKKHFYCSVCNLYVGSDFKDCEKCKGKKEDLSIFYDIDILHQIKTLFEDLDLAKYLSKPSKSGIITDLKSGSEYKRVRSSRKNPGPYDLTLIINTDGVSVIQASTNHCWPVFATIMELPFQIRNYNMMFVGLWFDKSIKPYMNSFLQPLAEKLKVGSKDGVVWTHPVTNKKEVTRFVAPCVIADAPARAEMQNVLHHNGKRGCNVCETIMTTLPGGTIRVYLYPDVVILRTEERIKEQAEKAEKLNAKSKAKKKKNVFGVKGKSVLSEFPLLNIARAMIPEIMHSVFLGIVKQFLFVWLYKKGPWSLKEFYDEINKIIKNLKTPRALHRPPRPLGEFKNYKAAEFLNFLLFFIVPIVSSFLPEVYLKHWLLLMEGIRILMQDEITKMDLIKADEILKNFLKQIPDIYGQQEMTYNVHQLIHLTLTVKRWGPLHHIWAFPFENQNHILTKSIHGTKHYGAEIINKLRRIQQLTIIKWKLFRHKIQKENEPFSTINKNLKPSKLSKENLAFLKSKNIDLNNPSEKVYDQMKIKGRVFTSTSYPPLKTNDYTVELSVQQETTYGEIEIFILKGKQLFIMFKPFHINASNFFFYEVNKEQTLIDYLIPVTEGTEKLLINFESIQSIKHVVRVTDYVFRPLEVAYKDL